MKKRLFLFLILIILLCAFVFYNNSNPKTIISQLVKKGEIKTGDFRYKIYLLGVFPVGEAILKAPKLEDYQGKKVYHLSAEAKNLEIFSKVFRALAILDSYIDSKNLSPILFKQKLVITGKPNIEREIFYDQENGIMTIGGVRRQIFPNTQDPLSIMFNLRQMNFDKLKDLEMSINTNQKNYILKGITEQKEISVNKKAYKIIVVKAEIKRRDKNPYHKSNITMLLVKSKVNIPILIRVFASGFLISAKLIEIK